MDGDTLYSIGDLARRTGLTVKTIRFYADQGIVPPTDRSPAGYRLYDVTALARLDLVRTLRDLGLDLPTIRKVVDREVSLPQVAAAHAEALAVQIRALRLRRAVLTAVARRGSSPEEMELMHKLARLSAEERHRLIADLFGGLDTDPALAGIMRSLTPELPDDPEPEQVEAWVELAELASDPDFRTSLHRLATHHTADRPTAHPHPTDRQATDPHATDRRAADREAPGGGRLVPVIAPDPAALARDHAGPALAQDIDPAAPEATPIVEAVLARYAEGLHDTTEVRHRLLTRLEAANDPRRERYLELLAVINGWPPPQSLAPALGWFIEALRARLTPADPPGRGPGRAGRTGRPRRST
ncbi:MerR family transcriptional regulator [Nonomuraea sp. NPDC050643]|uniref:MerR family transcriptional regulator n=1 Tax=Nonomuraea sp. NPDC050643 TaxID=3155660 RepID=UPI0033E3C051